MLAASAVLALSPTAASESSKKVRTLSTCQNDNILITWCMFLLAPSQEKNNGLSAILHLINDKTSMPSSCVIDWKVSLPGHAATTLSIGTSRPISDRKAWIAHENVVVALVFDNVGQEDNTVAIMLRDKRELNEVRALFLNTLIILSCTLYFFSIFATLDFDIGRNKLVDWDEEASLVE